MSDVKEISKMNINGTTYNIKDTEARAAAAEAKEEHDQMLHKTTNDAQSINSTVQFNNTIYLANGASIQDNGTTVTFM